MLLNTDRTKSISPFWFYSGGNEYREVKEFAPNHITCKRQCLNVKLRNSTAKKGKAGRNGLARQWEETPAMHSLLSGFVFYDSSVCLAVKKLSELTSPL